MYKQSPPTPIDLREDFLVELALLQYYGILTCLPNTKCSRPILTQCKPSDALRVMIVSKNVTQMNRHYHDSHNFPVTTLADAGAHLAGNNLLAKIDRSQSLHVLKMADPKSVQFLSSDFMLRTFANLRLAKGLS